jgi:hypothetical protein
MLSNTEVEVPAFKVACLYRGEVVKVGLGGGSQIR